MSRTYVLVERTHRPVFQSHDAALAAAWKLNAEPGSPGYTVALALTSVETNVTRHFPNPPILEDLELPV